MSLRESNAMKSSNRMRSSVYSPGRAPPSPSIRQQSDDEPTQKEHKTKISLDQIYLIQRRIQKILGFMNGQKKNTANEKKAYPFHQNTRPVNSKTKNFQSKDKKNSKSISPSKDKKQNSLNLSTLNLGMSILKKMDSKFIQNQEVFQKQRTKQKWAKFSSMNKLQIKSKDQWRGQHDIKYPKNVKNKNEQDGHQLFLFPNKDQQSQISSPWDNILKQQTQGSFLMLDNDINKLKLKKTGSYMEGEIVKPISPKKDEEEFIIMKPSDRKRIQNLLMNHSKDVNIPEKNNQINLFNNKNVSFDKKQTKNQTIENVLQQAHEQPNLSQQKVIVFTRNKFRLRTDEEFLIQKYNYSKSREKSLQKEQNLKQKYKLLDERLKRIKDKVAKNKPGCSEVKEESMNPTKQSLDMGHKEKKQILQSYDRYSPLKKLIKFNQKLKKQSIQQSEKQRLIENTKEIQKYTTVKIHEQWHNWLV